MQVCLASPSYTHVSDQCLTFISQCSIISCHLFIISLAIFSGGLLPAARAKQDSLLLATFDGGDPVAREMRYHRDCHRNYIADVSNKARLVYDTSY